MAILDYLSLIKFRYHISFLSIALASFLFSKQAAFLTLKDLALLYLSFNVLLYGGIYTLNDIADVAADRQHPLKRTRPLPSNRVPLSSAKLFATILISLGLASGFFFFGWRIMPLYLAFLTLTTLYTFFAKHIPYVELLVNSTTQALRPVLALVVIQVPIPWLLAAAYCFFSLGFVSIRRIVERDISGWEVNTVSTRYRLRNIIALTVIAFIAILAITIADWYGHETFYVLMVMFYIVFVLGINFSPILRRISKALVTR
ncbi:MAG TPA: UbiA family prenyltransferase [Candidatus Nanoarchaeia archaeon]|nr:UbiA family prenyltransferase [Candidatus Nanoarchaeia archaeon]